jgi:hypothetical protein
VKKNLVIYWGNKKYLKKHVVKQILQKFIFMKKSKWPQKAHLWLSLHCWLIWLWLHVKASKKNTNTLSSCIHLQTNNTPNVATLALGSRPRQGVARLRAKWETREHSTCSRECKECEGMSPHTPKWTPLLGVGVSKRLPNLQSAITGVKTPCL